jgi:hypothetical protein
MLSMGIWSLCHAVTTTLVGPDLESQVKSWISAGCQMIPSCSGWGSHPTWNDSHINSKHIQGDCQTLYDVDGDMEPPSCCYHHTCGTRFGKSGEIMDLCWVSNDTIMQWLRLSSHMEWFPHPLQRHKRWLPNIICCGWGYGAFIIIMLLPPHLWDQIWKVRWNYGSLLGVKWYHHAVVEALIPHGMIPTSTQNIYKVIDKHFMLWMGIWSPHHAVTTTTLAGPDLEVSWNHRSLLGVKWYHHAVVEALIPHGMIPTSTQNIYKVIDKHFMLWMGIWSPHHALTTTLAGPDLEVSWNHRSLLGVKWYHHAVVEALIPHGMIPTSTPKT